MHTSEPAYFTIHGLVDLRAALAAGSATGRPIVAVSGPVASAYAGADWFSSLLKIGRNEFPSTSLTGILDCGDRAGDAVSALRVGIDALVFTGHPDAARRLASLCAIQGVELLTARPNAFDLGSVADPAYTALRLCRCGT